MPSTTAGNAPATGGAISAEDFARALEEPLDAPLSFGGPSCTFPDCLGNDADCACWQRHQQAMQSPPLTFGTPALDGLPYRIAEPIPMPAPMPDAPVFTVSASDWGALGKTRLRCAHDRLSGQACWRCRAVVPWLNARLMWWQRAVDWALGWWR